MVHKLQLNEAVFLKKTDKNSQALKRSVNGHMGWGPLGKTAGCAPKFT